ncbi:hypothetical protein INT45_009814 [Circinella minor]|uniref:RRM domain-containing protein n=1 Tax=Circinella minor TaxID=1195481 RepID=A0A8H7S438_9FUNG|nr:hypothetical protein INT45_009814 [Circinella minor]
MMDMTQHQQQQQQLEYLSSPTSYLQLTAESAKTTLWMGDLEPWMDENYIRQVWLALGENVVVKLIRDKRTGVSAGYAFVGFTSSMSAQRALATVHGTRMPNMQRVFRLNWASGGGIHDRKEDRAPEYSLFVGDLSSEVDETLLLKIFRQHYASCHSAKVMTDPISGLSRGYGFVRFHDLNDQQIALSEMNGVYCGNRPMRVSLATPKNSNARYHQLALQAPALVQQPTDPSNTTVFVGGLSSPVTEDELRRYFTPFGDIVYVKIPPNKGCGFVQYVSRPSAELAIEQMNGFQIGSSRIRLSWGRSQTDKSLNSNNNENTVVAVTNNLDHDKTNSFLTTNSTLLRYQQQQQQQPIHPSLETPMNLTMGPTQSATSGTTSIDTFGSFSPPLTRHQFSPTSGVFTTNTNTTTTTTTEFGHLKQEESSVNVNTWLYLKNNRDQDTSWRLNGIYA